MSQNIGESRDAWGRDVWKMAEDFANTMKKEVKPFYIVYCAKQDKDKPHVFRQTIKAYYTRPAALLGILVWYVDNAQGIFQFQPELSCPYDVPLDPSLLSEKAEDALPTVMAKGEKMKVILS